MSLFEHADFDNHQHVSFFKDPQSGLNAIIAVHNTQLGPSLGGCRMFPYASSEEALVDVLRLSKGMTYKAAMADLPQGGGKAVIIGDPRKDKSKALMQSMGRAVDTFKGQYVIAEDSGMTVQDLQQIATQTEYAAGTSAKFSYDGSPADGNPAPSTAYGVFMGIKAAVEFSMNSGLQGKTVAIQGLGHVGLRLAAHLYTAGVKLIVADIYSEGVEAARQQFGARVVAPSEIHKVEADVFAPCAMGGAINERTLPEIKAKIIAGAANNQLVSQQIGELLHEHGLVYVPDYVINAGGIIDIYHQSHESSADNLRNHLEQIGDTVEQILRRSQQMNMPSEQVSNKIAEEKFKPSSVSTCKA